MVEISHVTYDYVTDKGSEVRALEDVSLSIERQEFLCIVGASGCGKTTLLQLIAGYLFPTKGRIKFENEEIKGPDWTRGVVFQQPNLYPWLSVEDNVSFGPRMRGLDRRDYQEKVYHFIDLVGLSEFRRHAPYQLSGGMQQRVAIARALVNDPHLLLMDEPFGALDQITRERLQDELLKIFDKTKITVVFITHSVEEAVFLGSRVIVMSPRPGRIFYERGTRLNRAGVPERNRLAPGYTALREEITNQLYQSFSD
ncbi:MAG: ABC transporter ATP-binding protein [Alcaligenaceae bacterium]|nr:ABC transporter ATP-binding protein [Alcaligenaceae bacterium]